MSLLDWIVLAVIGFAVYVAVTAYRAKGPCGCGKKDCPNRKNRGSY